jgi:hypothetical protein
MEDFTTKLLECDLRLPGSIKPALEGRLVDGMPWVTRRFWDG